MPCFSVADILSSRALEFCASNSRINASNETSLSVAGLIDEQAAVAGGKIDLVVSDGSTRTYYEVKIAGRFRSCIRQALGKLLEYSYWPGAQTERKLVIVGEHRCDEAAERYMDDLRERFSLSVYYETR